MNLFIWVRSKRGFTWIAVATWLAAFITSFRHQVASVVLVIVCLLAIAAAYAVAEEKRR